LGKKAKKEDTWNYIGTVIRTKHPTISRRETSNNPLRREHEGGELRFERDRHLSRAWGKTTSLCGKTSLKRVQRHKDKLLSQVLGNRGGKRKFTKCWGAGY